MNTVYLGTSAFAGAVLARLHDSPHRPTLVLSRPDSPSGRGRKLAPPPTVEVASSLGVSVYQPDSVNSQEARDAITEASPDMLVVCAFGALIKDPLLSDFPILNVHPSLLPRWRGAAPIERSILAGDTQTGVSIMQLTAGLDSGPVCLQQALPIAPSDDYGSMAAQLAKIGGELLVQALDHGDVGTLEPLFQAQGDSGVTYAEKLTADDRRLDLARPAVELALRVRALSPHVGAYTELADGSRLGIWEAAVATGEQATFPVLETADGQLELRVVQPAGKKRMAGDAYLRGQRR